MNSRNYSIAGLLLSDDDKKKYPLLEIEKILRRNGTSLSRFESMPRLPRTSSDDSNVLVLDERSYCHTSLLETLDRDIPKMTCEQKFIYDQILSAVNKGDGGMFFVSGFGGTGKTFLWKLLSAAIRSRGDIVLNVASSGIASLLLQGGRTAHSRFSIALNPDEFSSCTMKHGTDQSNLVKASSLIIWDEAPMMSKHCEEKIYNSADSIDPSDTTSVNNEALSSDFLNTIKVSGLPNHSLRLKVGCPVMVLRNIAPTDGLMNGTRLQITHLMDFMVRARIITGERRTIGGILSAIGVQKKLKVIIGRAPYRSDQLGATPPSRSDRSSWERRTRATPRSRSRIDHPETTNPERPLAATQRGRSGIVEFQRVCVGGRVVAGSERLF
uniref:ATP-dependent DNA helicase n=1 Tax=Brassica oleracea var. oleracea TaxID=109376 RepID=A0A0D2ZTJ8_BRAOL